jgi:hypothetical protein
MSEKIPRTRITYNKEPLAIYDDQQALDSYLWTNGFKFRITHSEKGIICKILHEEITPEHMMTNTYRQCVSVKCHNELAEKMCSYEIKQSQCLLDSKFYLFIPRNVVHLNKYPTSVDVYPGLHCFYELEITRIVKERPCSATNIYIILSNNQKNNSMNYPAIAVPDVDQINNYLKRSREKVLSEIKEEIAQVDSFVKANQYDKLINPDKPFCFGSKMGDGSETNHLRVGISTIKLLKNIYQVSLDHEYMYHIDTTYKLTKNGFPFIVFGYTDKSGHFFVIAFMLISHEEAVDFEWFYLSLKDIYKISLNIDFSPKYIMQDASKSEAKAATNVFKDVNIIMCYFHVILNCKKQDKWDLVKKKDIKKLYLSMNEEEFLKIKEYIFKKWIESGDIEFKNYFENQWINGFFNKLFNK